MSEAITGSATRSEPTVRRIADHSVFARGFLLYISQSPTKTPANPLEGSMSANDANDPSPYSSAIDDEGVSTTSPRVRRSLLHSASPKLPPLPVEISTRSSTIIDRE